MDIFDGDPDIAPSSPSLGGIGETGTDNYYTFQEEIAVEAEAEQRLADDETVVPTPIPYDAYVSKPSAEGKVANNCDVSSQESIDAYFNNGHEYLQTGTYSHSNMGPGISLRDYFQGKIDNGSMYHNAAGLMLSGAVSDRPLYNLGGGGAGGGSGGPISLPVDYRYSPFIIPSLLNEQFEIEAVLRAGFLPGFRPGEDAIIAHPDRYATMRVMTIDKDVVYASTNFMMEGYTKATKESFKVIESTLGNTLQLNKEKFKIFKMNLGLVDAQEPFDWLRSWEDKWNRYMRASVLARNRWRWYILFGSHLIGGYPLQYSLGASAKDEPYTGITVDIFVTDDILLPEMKRMTTEAGLVYFRWGGTTYNPNTLQFEKTIPEYPTSPPKATSPDESEFENESLSDTLMQGPV